MKNVLVTSLALVVLAGSAHAMGQGGGGQGRTKIDFQFDSVDATKSRIHAKIDVSANVSQLGNTGSKSLNDDLAGYTMTISFGSASFSATADSKGKTKQDSTATPPVPFTAKLTGNGKILDLMATGLNLKDLLGVDTTKESGQVSVEIDVSASKTDNSVIPPVTTTISLSKQIVTFDYSVKHTTVKGKNF